MSDPDNLRGGKSPQNGRFVSGNQYWRARKSHGAPLTFETADDLWQKCVEYFEWVEAHPLFEAQAFAYQGSVKVKNLPKMRAMTLGGLCLYLGIHHRTWYSQKDRGSDFEDVMDMAYEIIRAQKFEGAAAGLLNSNIIARDLGLASKHDLSSLDGTMSPRETDPRALAKAVALLMQKGLSADGPDDDGTD